MTKQPQSLWHTLTAPLSELYHNTVAPFYVWLGTALGGRAKAGRLGRYSRIIRLCANALSLTVLILGVASIGFAAFWAGDVVLPLWSLSAMGAGVITNTLAIIVGAAANHLKIEQYYDAELELHAANNELRAELGDNTISLRRSAQKTRVGLARGLHDLNGFGGSIVGWASAIPGIMLLASASTYHLAPHIAVILFVVSRASALLSVLAVWGTNQYRLSAYKASIRALMDTHERLKSQQNPKRHAFVVGLVNDVLDQCRVDKKDQYTHRVRYALYRAMDGACHKVGIDQRLRMELILALYQQLSPLIKGKYFSRETLMQIQGPHTRSLAVLDTFPILERELFDTIASRINPEYPKIQSQAASTSVKDPMVLYYLKSSLSQGRGELKAASKQGSACLMSDGQVNHATVLRQYPVKGPHREVYLPSHHAQQVALELLDTKYQNKTV